MEILLTGLLTVKTRRTRRKASSNQTRLKKERKKMSGERTGETDGQTGTTVPARLSYIPGDDDYQ